MTQLSLDIKPITASTITRLLVWKYLHSPGLIGEGVYLFNRWESDFVRITPAGFLTEWEIKVSRSDFRADFKKVDKHRSIAAGEWWKHFWYIAPRGIIPLDEIPEYAGLIECVTKTGDMYHKPRLIVLKKAPSLNGKKIGANQQQRIYKSAYYKYFSRLL